jgi:transketolase C-terminal domain/subunit
LPPQENFIPRAAPADQLVVENVRRHADQKQILLALPDDFVAGGIGDQVGETLHGDGIAVMHVFGNGFRQRNQSRQGILLLICHYG